MRITFASDPKVMEFLEYLGVSDSRWCQIQIDYDGIVGVEHGIGTKPPWHVERQQAALLKILESHAKLKRERVKYRKGISVDEFFEDSTELPTPI